METSTTTMESAMENLFLSDNHLVLSRIFLALDGRSIKAARLVCKRWDAFIRDHIWGCTLYRDILRHNLNLSWLDCVPSRSGFTCQAPVFDLAADARQVVVSLENGDIEIWDRSKESDEEGQEEEGGYVRKMTIKTGCQHGLRLGLTPSHIVGAFFEQNVRVWHRITGQLLQLQPVTSSVHGLSLRPASDQRPPLALVSMVSGQVAIFNCQSGTLQEEGTITPGMSRGPNHMSADGQWLLLGSSRRDLVLYDLDGRREVRRLYNRHRVWSLQMRYPLAASSGVKRVRGDNDNEERVGGEWEVELRGAGEEGDGGSGGVLLWNLVEGQVVRRVTVKHLVTLAMDQRRLLMIRPKDVILLPLTPGGKGGEGGVGNRLYKIATLSEKDCFPNVSGDNFENWSMAGAIVEKDKLILQSGKKEQVTILDYWLNEGKRDGQNKSEQIHSKRSRSNSRNNNARQKHRLWAVASAAVVIPLAWIVSRWN